MQIEQIGIGQLHWSTANYAPLQELALWDGLVAMYEQVTIHNILLVVFSSEFVKRLICEIFLGRQYYSIIDKCQFVGSLCHKLFNVLNL